MKTPWDDNSPPDQTGQACRHVRLEGRSIVTAKSTIHLATKFGNLFHAWSLVFAETTPKGYLDTMFELDKDFESFSLPVRQMLQGLGKCTLCPRQCKVNRLSAETGYCQIGANPRLSSAGPHFGEESVLVGHGGSGTMFFSGCNLSCIFCQNYQISQEINGRELSIEQLAEIMLSLAEKGCCNVNFVSPTHVVASVAAAIELARQQGLTVPTVYNSGGYDSVSTIRKLEGLIDIYMPDMKYGDSALASDLSDAPDYAEVCFAAVKEMHRQTGDLQCCSGLAVKGLLVRHLVLPNGAAQSESIIDFLAQEISRSTSINVMDQYRPCYRASGHAIVNRRPGPEEIERIRNYALRQGLHLL